MKKINRIYIFCSVSFIFFSCTQIKDNKESTLDKVLYDHVDSLILNEKENSSLDIDSPNFLPIYGFKEIKDNGGTVYHTIPKWEFVNQNGEVISSEDYKGYVCVVDFFFTNCPTICPKMTLNMRTLQEKTKGMGVRFLSYTVDPKRDTSATLKNYRESYGINADNWNMLTGDQYKIYELGVNGYLVPNQEDALAPGGFLHSEMFILIDPKGRIRGYYDGTDPESIDKIVYGINQLIQEI